MSTAEASDKVADALVERLFMASIEALGAASIHVGGRLGFYRSLAQEGDAAPAGLAERTGTAERYTREWLEQQAVAGFLRVDSSEADAGSPRAARISSSADAARCRSGSAHGAFVAGNGSGSPLSAPRRRGQAPGFTSIVVVFVRVPCVKIRISCEPGVSGCSSATHPSATDWPGVPAAEPKMLSAGSTKFSGALWTWVSGIARPSSVAVTGSNATTLALAHARNSTSLLPWNGGILESAALGAVGSHVDPGPWLDDARERSPTAERRNEFAPS